MRPGGPFKRYGAGLVDRPKRISRDYAWHVKPLSATGLTENLLVKISGVASTRRGPAFLQSCRLRCGTAAGCKIIDSYWQEDWTPGPGYFVCTVIAVINADAPLAVGVLKKCCKVWMLISVSTKSSSARRCTAPSTEHIDNFILAFLILLIDFFSIQSSRPNETGSPFAITTHFVWFWIRDNRVLEFISTTRRGLH